VEELPVIACALGAEDLAERRERWRRLVETALLERVEIASGVELRFRREPGVEEEVRALAGLERECCRFASFDVDGAAETVTLAVRSSGDGVGAAREIFG
jgi:hypothetical protein